MNRLVVCFLSFVFLCASILLFAEEAEGDAFGDPFGDSSDSGADNSDSDSSFPGDTILEALSLSRTTELSGEVSFRPILYIDKYNDAYLDGEFVSSEIGSELRVESTFGRARFIGEFSTSFYPPDSFEVSPGEIAFAYRNDVVDIETGLIPIEWSPMNVFALTNFFGAAASGPGGLNDIDRSLALMAGFRALFYIGFVTLEVAASPVYARVSSSSSLRNQFETSLYPDDMELRFTDNRPVSLYKNGEAAARVGAEIGPASLYLLGFHGYKSAQTITFEGAVPDVYLAVTSEYPKIDVLGAILSLDLFGIIANAEAVVTFGDPVIVDQNKEISFVGTVTDKLIETPKTFAWSAGFEWELISNLRLIGEYTDHYIIDDTDNVDESLLPGDTAFAAIDVLMPLSRAELGITVAATYDWSGGELAAIGSARVDVLNGITMEAQGIYLDVIDATDSTSSLFETIEEDIIISISLQYSF